MGKLTLTFETKGSKQTLETSDEKEVRRFIIDNIKKADLNAVKIEITRLS